MSQNSPKQWFNLEELFYNQLDQKLLNDLKAELETTETADAIMHVTGITDEELAKEIAGKQVTVDTLAAFRLVPLIAVAWADDRVEENERYTITVAAEKSGIQPDDASMALIKQWTERRPDAQLLETWCDYAAALSASLAESHRQALKAELMTQVKDVAEACGGVLGFGSVSDSEKAVIQRIEKALGGS